MKKVLVTLFGFLKGVGTSLHRLNGQSVSDKFDQALSLVQEVHDTAQTNKTAVVATITALSLEVQRAEDLITQARAILQPAK